MGLLEGDTDGAAVTGDLLGALDGGAVGLDVTGDLLGDCVG